jgi:hypothetical protein
VADWFTADASTGVPRAIMAESYRRVLVAHDFIEVKPSAIYLRGPTFVYDPSQVVEADRFQALTADLDRDGDAETVRFRGVVEHKGHMWGWGYGTGSEEDRPDILRSSKISNPAVWLPEHYLILGHRSDPILAGLSVGDVLLAFKESSLFAVHGSGWQNFGSQPVDSRYGVVGARAAVEVGGRAYFWSLEGPRVSVGGESEDLALPLGLDGPEPADLIAAGDGSYAHAVYVPGERCVLFFFPDLSAATSRVYCLSLRDPDAPEWSYWTLGRRILSAAVFYYGGATGGSVPEGYPSFTAAADVTSSSASVEFANNAAVGDEFVETWISTDAGTSYSKAGEVAVNGLASQTFALSGLPVDTTVLVAQRYRRGTYYGAGSEGAPGTWPPAQQGSFDTDESPPPPADPDFTAGVATLDALYVTVPLSWLNPDSLPWSIYEASAPSLEEVAALTFADADLRTTGTAAAYSRVYPRSQRTIEDGEPYPPIAYYRLWLVFDAAPGTQFEADRTVNDFSG